MPFSLLRKRSIKNKRSIDGYGNICKPCYREKVKQLTMKYSQQTYHPKTTECSQCHTRKSLSEFPRDKTRKHGVRGTCKTCTIQNRHIYLEHLEMERLIQANSPVEKECCECHQVKPIKEFHWSSVKDFLGGKRRKNKQWGTREKPSFERRNCRFQIRFRPHSSPLRK